MNTLTILEEIWRRSLTIRSRSFRSRSCLKVCEKCTQSFDGRKTQCPFCKDDLEYEEGRQRRLSQRQEAVAFDAISSPTSNPPQTTSQTPQNMDFEAELHEQIKLAEEKGEILRKQQEVMDLQERLRAINFRNSEIERNLAAKIQRYTPCMLAPLSRAELLTLLYEGCAWRATAGFRR